VGTAELPVLDEIRGDARLSAVGRLDVYARMYCARLIDALREDFPRVATVLGTEVFADVAHAYLAAYPSTHPSLRWLGRDFANHLAHDPPASGPAFLADLARLEWARLAVFDAADAAVLELETLRRLPPEHWSELRLRFVPAVASLTVAWPVHRIWEAIETDATAAGFASHGTTLRVWRQGDRVFQSAMDDAEQTAFVAVTAGETFADVCERLAAVVSPEQAPALAGALTLRWLEDGVLAAASAR
jgi:hypothetical protein